MHVVVFADRAGRALAPFTDRTCVALLPIAGRPLVVHTLEALAEAGLRELWLVVSPMAERVEATLADGTRYGVRITYVPARAGDAPREVLRRIRSQLSGPTLVLRGDVLRSGALAPFLEHAKALDAPAVHGTIQDVPAGVVLLADGAADAPDLPGDPEETGAWHAGAVELEMEAASLALLESIAAYHRGCLDAASGTLPGLRLPGRELAPGVRVGPHARLSAASVKSGPALVGARCHVHRDASLEGDVVLADDVVVEAHATLRESVVLGGTYVGEHVLLERAIAWGDLLFHVDHGVAVRIVDSFLLADLSPAVLRMRLAGLAERAAGALLLVLSLPLWPLALVLSLMRDPRRPLRSERVAGNRGQRGADGLLRRRGFRRHSFATHVGPLRHLPDLVAVARGDLCLVGVPPDVEAPGRFPPASELERMAASAPRGVYGPVHALDAGPEDDARVLAAAEYAARRTPRDELAWILRGLCALFTPRTWLPGPSAR
jgi:hypothetical protein